MRVVRVPSEFSEEQAALAAVESLRAGGLVVFPTETVYGLGVLATDAGALERLRRVKDRPDRPFSVHVAGVPDVMRYVRQVAPPARRLMAAAWPGPVTVVLPVGGRLADSTLPDWLYGQLCLDDTIALRCPDEPVAHRMLAELDQPVAAGSANRRGGKPPRSGKEALEALSAEGEMDLLVDCGPTRLGKPSTIVRFEGHWPRIVRPGVYDEATIRRLCGRRVLFVCTGNTCRSPMAEALARRVLAEEMGLSPEQLAADAGVEIRSAGVMAGAGMPATQEAVRAVAGLGGALEDHRSHPLTNELIDWADLIFCLSVSHAAAIVELAPRAEAKVHLLDERGSIPDPIGADLEVYHRTAEMIEQALRQRMGEGLV